MKPGFFNVIYLPWFHLYLEKFTEGDRSNVGNAFNTLMSINDMK